MFESGQKYLNRYLDEYSWKKINESTYHFVMTGDSMKYARFGGKRGQEKMDMDDLGMFDPSGGPYVSVGMMIDEKPITRLYTFKDSIGAEVEYNGEDE